MSVRDIIHALHSSYPDFEMHFWRGTFDHALRLADVGVLCDLVRALAENTDLGNGFDTARRVVELALERDLPQDHALDLLTPLMLAARSARLEGLAVERLIRLVGMLDEDLKSRCTGELKSHLLNTLDHPAEEGRKSQGQLQMLLLLAALLDRRAGFDEHAGQQSARLMLAHTARVDVDALINRRARSVDASAASEQLTALSKLVDHPALPQESKRQAAIALTDRLIEAFARFPSDQMHIQADTLRAICELGFKAPDQHKQRLVTQLLERGFTVEPELADLTQSISNADIRNGLLPIVYRELIADVTYTPFERHVPRLRQLAAAIRIDHSDRSPLLDATLRVQIAECAFHERDLDTQALLTFLLDPDGLARRPDAETGRPEPFTYPTKLGRRRKILQEAWSRILHARLENALPTSYIQDLRQLTAGYIKPEPADWESLLAELTAHRERSAAATVVSQQV